MNKQKKITEEIKQLTNFQTEAKYLVIVEFTFDGSFFSEMVEPVDQAATKLTIFRNLLVSAEDFESILKISYRKSPNRNSFALIIEGNSFDEIHEFIDLLPTKMDFILQSDLLEVQVNE
ncbi:MAG: hypothetical protein GF308_00265 [Candidatus Heimdallarchaeota archaeon]|nr:hypothetical protein [Candidatus Heimdallarchaeota archaeon]